MRKGMEIQFKQLAERKDSMLVELAGELDYAQVKGMEGMWREKVCHAQDKYIVVDCRKVRYMDSTGLALLLEAVIARGVEKPMYFIIDKKAYIYLVIEITGAAKIMNILQSPDQIPEKLV